MVVCALCASGERFVEWSENRDENKGSVIYCEKNHTKRQRSLHSTPTPVPKSNTTTPTPTATPYFTIRTLHIASWNSVWCDIGGGVAGVDIIETVKNFFGGRAKSEGIVIKRCQALKRKWLGLFVSLAPSCVNVESSTKCCHWTRANEIFIKNYALHWDRRRQAC